jgi:hypothetical protein
MAQSYLSGWGRHFAVGKVDILKKPVCPTCQVVLIPEFIKCDKPKSTVNQKPIQFIEGWLPLVQFRKVHLNQDHLDLMILEHLAASLEHFKFIALGIAFKQTDVGNVFLTTILIDCGRFKFGLLDNFPPTSRADLQERTHVVVVIFKEFIRPD